MVAVPQHGPGAEMARVSEDGTFLRLVLCERDAEMVRAAQDGAFGPDPALGYKRCARVGFLAIQAGAGHAGLGHLLNVEERLQRMREIPEEVATRLGREIRNELVAVVGENGRHGMLAEALDPVFAAAAQEWKATLASLMTQLLGPSSVALPQVLERRLVEAMNCGVTALLARLAADDGPLASDRAALDALRQQTTELERRLGDAIAALSEKIAVARASVTPIVAGKGFESAAVDDLAAITAVFGDHVEPTGDKPGSARTKAGDVVLHLAESIDGFRVAVECRTGTSSRLTLQAARDAMINRSAAAALLLADRPELLPRDAEQAGFRIYFGESVVALHHDRDDLGSQRMLAVAVQVARLLARLNSAQSGAGADLATIGDTLARIEAGLTHLRPLRGAVTGIDRETARIQQHAGLLETEIRRALVDLAALVTKPAA